MKEHADRISILWALGFSVAFPLSVYALSQGSLSVPVSILLIAVNTGLLGIYSIKLVRSLKMLDEVQIRIQLEAVTIAFVLSVHLVMIMGLTELAMGSGHISYLYVFPAFFLFYVMGLLISRRKY